MSRPRGAGLATHRLDAYYGDFQALFGVETRIEPGETVAIIGANGAGKSTYLKTVAGLLSCPPDRVTLDGAPIGALPAAHIVRLGVSLVPEGRRLFPSLTVEENLLVGARAAAGGGWSLARVYALFPMLAGLRRRPSTTLSGGQQQMAAIGRALMANPRILLCDEISLGLAPPVVRDIYAALPAIREEGASVILVEQDIAQAMAVADRVYCFQEGRISLAGAPGSMTRAQIHAAYFGI